MFLLSLTGSAQAEGVVVYSWWYEAFGRWLDVEAAQIEQVPGETLSLDQYWSLPNEARAGYTLGVLDTVANEAQFGPAYSNCVSARLRDQSFMKELVKLTDDKPEVRLLPAPLAMRAVVDNLCKSYADPRKP